MLTYLRILSRRPVIRPNSGSSPYGGPPPTAAITAQLRAQVQSCAQHSRIWQFQPLQRIRFVVVDTETTGFYPARGDEIISVGAVVVENGQIQADQTFHRLVNPFRPIPPAITDLTGITQAMVDDQADIFTVLSEFLDFLEGGLIVGHCIGFDLEFINRKLGVYCGTHLQNPHLDTTTLSRSLQPSLGNHSLDHILKVLEIQPVGRHTALGDAKLTAQILIHFLKSPNLRNIFTIECLHTLCRQTNVQGAFPPVFM